MKSKKLVQYLLTNALTLIYTFNYTYKMLIRYTNGYLNIKNKLII